MIFSWYSICLSFSRRDKFPISLILGMAMQLALVEFKSLLRFITNYSIGFIQCFLMFSNTYIAEWSPPKYLAISHMNLTSVIISIPIGLQKKSVKSSEMEAASHCGQLGSWLMNNAIVFSRGWSTFVADNPAKAGTKICMEIRQNGEKTTPDNL